MGFCAVLAFAGAPLISDADLSLAATGVDKFHAYNAFNANLPNMSYIDLFGTWNTPFKGLTLRAGIDNLLDKDPPLATTEIVAGGAANTYSTYDQLGRQVYLAFTEKF